MPAAVTQLLFSISFLRQQVQAGSRSPVSPHGPSSSSSLQPSHAAGKSTSGYESAGDTLSSRSEPLCSERPSWGPGRGGSSSITGSALDGFNDASTIPDSLYESSSNASDDHENTALRCAPPPHPSFPMCAHIHYGPKLPPPPPPPQHPHPDLPPRINLSAQI